MERKLAGSLTLSLMLVMSASGAKHPSNKAGTDADKQIRIRVHNYAQVDSRDLVSAEGIADGILHEAGVEAVWIECSAGDLPAKDAACDTPYGPTELVLNLLPKSMSARFQLGADRFGVALESEDGGYGFVAWIFSDLVKEAAAKEQLTRQVLLGTVISHELGHLLLSTNSHSPFGLMRAKWSHSELLAVEQRTMYFSSSESRRIQQGLRGRRQSAADRTQSASVSLLNAAGEIDVAR